MNTRATTAPTKAITTCDCGGVARYWILSPTRPVTVACVICADQASPYVIVRRMDPARPGASTPATSLEVASSKKFVLEGRTPREAAISEWAAWLDTHLDECCIARTHIALGCYVRTEFVGLATCLFETMVFGGALHGDQTRYRTYEEAEAGHGEVVARVRAAFVERKTLRPASAPGSIDLTKEGLDE